MTVGVDTHLWSLSYAHMRAHALRRAGEPEALADGAPLTTLPLRAWSLLHAPISLGFLAAPALASLVAAAPHAQVDAAAAEAAVCAAVASEAAERMLAAEPMRWPGLGGAELVERLRLGEAAARMLEHQRALLATQTRMYLRAAHAPPQSRSCPPTCYLLSLLAIATC